MRTIFLLISLFILSPAGFSQSTDEEIDYIQAIFGMEKRAAVKDFLDLQGTAEVNFWKLYDEYEVTRKEYGKQRIRLLESSVERFESMSGEESDLWMKEILSLRKKNEILIEKYYKKIRKECSSATAMQFYQIESYILAGIRFQILESLPF